MLPEGMVAPRAAVWPRPIRYVIFDYDGTLVDTESIYAWSVEQLVGHKIDWSLRQRLMGAAAADVCRMVIEECGLTGVTIEALDERRCKLLDQRWGDVQPMPGACELVAEFHRRGIPMAIATASRRERYLQKAKHMQAMTSLISVVITGSDLNPGEGKPNPAIFLKAMKALGGGDPSECVVIEDAIAGIKAARAAGMAAVFVPPPEVDAGGAAAELVLRSLDDFPLDAFMWSSS